MVASSTLAGLSGKAATRHAVTVAAQGDGVPLMLAHGFGADQGMWRRVVPLCAGSHPVVTFDHVGCGQSDLTAYSSGRYATLRGYADDVVELIDELGLDDLVYVGHSVSGMIGLLASLQRPNAFRAIVTIGASPRYLDDAGYVGGFSRADIDGVLAAIESNWLAWGQTMAPIVMANEDRPDLAAELATSFARSHARIAQEFARAIFLSDYRDQLAGVEVPVLVLQSQQDPMVPMDVAHYLASRLANSTLVNLDASGHYPHVSAEAETASAVLRFVAGLN